MQSTSAGTTAGGKGGSHRSRVGEEVEGTKCKGGVTQITGGGGGRGEHFRGRGGECMGRWGKDSQLKGGEEAEGAVGNTMQLP